ncbi:MAG TPA: type II secretion system F family protein [Candidatus Limnocylindria bacterium]|jgi:tight adherence protein B
MTTPLLAALLGTATMATFALGLWMPAYLRHRTVRRRLAGFVHVGTASGFAIDTGGRRRSRAARRTVDDRNRWIVRAIGQMIVQAQADLSVGEVVAAMAVLGTFSFTLASVTMGSLVVGAVIGLVGSALPLGWLRWQQRRVERRFVAQLLDTIVMLASSVRSGQSLLQALEHATTESPEPTRSALALVVREIGMGASQEDALERMADRLPTDDLKIIVSALNVHHQVGGSLAKVLDAIAATIRERVRVAGDIRGITAQQRYSAYILSLLPVAAAAALMVFSPDYIGVLFEPGPLRALLVAAAVMVVMGFLVMRQLAKIDV